MTALTHLSPFSISTQRTFSQHPSLETAKLQVIVVDDILMIREHITEILMETGLVGIIGWAAHVRSAIEAIHEARPDAVILDIGIPGTLELHNGIAVLKWIKRTYPLIYVVMLTNMSDPVYREECLRAGAFSFLDKSCEFDQLPEVIKGIAGLVFVALPALTGNLSFQTQ